MTQPNYIMQARTHSQLSEAPCQNCCQVDKVDMPVVNFPYTLRYIGGMLTMSGNPLPLINLTVNVDNAVDKEATIQRHHPRPILMPPIARIGMRHTAYWWGAADVIGVGMASHRLEAAATETDQASA